MTRATDDAQVLYEELRPSEHDLKASLSSLMGFSKELIKKGREEVRRLNVDIEKEERDGLFREFIQKARGSAVGGRGAMIGRGDKGEKGVSRNAELMQEISDGLGRTQRVIRGEDERMDATGGVVEDSSRQLKKVRGLHMGYDQVMDEGMNVLKIVKRKEQMWTVMFVVLVAVFCFMFASVVWKWSYRSNIGTFIVRPAAGTVGVFGRAVGNALRSVGNLVRFCKQILVPGHARGKNSELLKGERRKWRERNRERRRRNRRNKPGGLASEDGKTLTQESESEGESDTDVDHNEDEASDRERQGREESKNSREDYPQPNTLETPVVAQKRTRILETEKQGKKQLDTLEEAIEALTNQAPQADQSSVESDANAHGRRVSTNMDGKESIVETDGGSLEDRNAQLPPLEREVRSIDEIRDMPEKEERTEGNWQPTHPETSMDTEEKPGARGEDSVHESNAGAEGLQSHINDKGEQDVRDQRRAERGITRVARCDSRPFFLVVQPSVCPVAIG